MGWRRAGFGSRFVGSTYRVCRCGTRRRELYKKCLRIGNLVPPPHHFGYIFADRLRFMRKSGNLLLGCLNARVNVSLHFILWGRIYLDLHLYGSPLPLPYFTR